MAWVSTEGMHLHRANLKKLEEVLCSLSLSPGIQGNLCKNTNWTQAKGAAISKTTHKETLKTGNNLIFRISTL